MSNYNVDRKLHLITKRRSSVSELINYNRTNMMEVNKIPNKQFILSSSYKNIRKIK